MGTSIGSVGAAVKSGHYTAAVAFKLQRFGVKLCGYRFSSWNLFNFFSKRILSDSEYRTDASSLWREIPANHVVGTKISYANLYSHPFATDAMSSATIQAASPTIQAVDLFCGIGGLTHGLRLSGVTVKAGFDTDLSCRHAFEANNDGAEFVCKDVREVQFADIEPYYEAGKVTALVGCAPCQPFSAHNRRKTKSATDCSLVSEFARLVREGMPDLVSMENVPGLAKHFAFEDLLATLIGLDYEINHSIVSCERHGIPQRRRRLVLLASRCGPVSLPIWDVAPPTVGDCIRHLPTIEHGAVCPDDPAHATLALSPINGQRIAQSKPGGSWEDWDDHLVNECHRNAHYPAPYGRMRWDDLSPTITTQFCYYSTGRFGHPEQDRTISVREAALLQTFPRNYVLIDEDNPLTIRELARHIGNAVPVSLGIAIGTAFCGVLK